MHRNSAQRDVVLKCILPRDSKAFRATHSRPENVFVDRFVAIAMGTHSRLGERCQLRLIDLPGTSFVRLVADWAMTLFVPEEIELKKALVHALDFGWPIRLSPGTYNLGIFYCSGVPCGRPLSITGFGGQIKTKIFCTWILNNSSCIFEDLALQQSCSTRFDFRFSPHVYLCIQPTGRFSA
jgi:hypothetical protein